MAYRVLYRNFLLGGAEGGDVCGIVNQISCKVCLYQGLEYSKRIEYHVPFGSSGNHLLNNDYDLFGVVAASGRLSAMQNIHPSYS